MKSILALLLLFVAVASHAAEFAEYKIAVATLGEITVIDPAGEPGYRVRLADGQVTAFAAHSGDPSADNAVADIEHALAHPAPAPVPHVLPRSSFIVAIRRVLGITSDDVLAIIEQLPAGDQRDTARDLWANARSFYRSNSFVTALAALNGNTPAQLDEVFRVGATLNLD